MENFPQGKSLMFSQIVQYENHEWFTLMSATTL